MGTAEPTRPQWDEGASAGGVPLAEAQLVLRLEVAELPLDEGVEVGVAVRGDEGPPEVNAGAEHLEIVEGLWGGAESPTFLGSRMQIGRVTSKPGQDWNQQISRSENGHSGKGPREDLSI